MNTPHSDQPDNQIDAKLQAVAVALAAPPPWCDAWSKLTEASSDEERRAVYQAIRRNGTLPEEASFFLVSTLVDRIALQDADYALRSYEDRMKAIEEEYRLGEGGVWPAGAAPAGYEALRQKYYRAWDEVFARKLKECGEPEMARLFRHDKAQFNRLSDAGRRYFFGPESDAESLPAVWLRGLVEAVAGCIEADSAMGPLGYRYGEEDDLWQIDLYPTPVELLGGAVDGEVVDPGFTLDIEQFRGLFDRIDALAWQSLGFPFGEGPQMAVEGVYRGHHVFVQVLAYAPDDEEAGRRPDTIDSGVDR
jgi:hypothetical protein